MSCVLLDRAPEEMTGRGAGLSDDGLRRKIEVIYQGIAVNHPEKTDVIGVLSALGRLRYRRAVRRVFGRCSGEYPCHYRRFHQQCGGTVCGTAVPDGD